MRNLPEKSGEGERAVKVYLFKQGALDWGKPLRDMYYDFERHGGIVAYNPDERQWQFFAWLAYVDSDSTTLTIVGNGGAKSDLELIGQVKSNGDFNLAKRDPQQEKHQIVDSLIIGPVSTVISWGGKVFVKPEECPTVGDRVLKLRAISDEILGKV